MKKLTTGLKKGDKFEDGGRVFIIDQVLPNGDYISHIAAADGTTEEEKETAKKKSKKVKTQTETTEEETKTTEETETTEGETEP